MRNSSAYPLSSYAISFRRIKKFTHSIDTEKDGTKFRQFRRIGCSDLQGKILNHDSKLVNRILRGKITLTSIQENELLTLKKKSLYFLFH